MALVEGVLTLQQKEISDSKWIPLKEAPLHLTFLEAQNLSLKVATLLESHLI